MQNTTRICVRYESEIYGAATIRAIKEKCSNMLLFLIFFITILIGYFYIFNLTSNEEEQSETSQQEAGRQRRRSIIDNLEKKSHGLTPDTTNREPLPEEESVRATSKPYRSTEEDKHQYEINEEQRAFDRESSDVADNSQGEDTLNHVSMLAERFVDSLLQQSVRNLKETGPFPDDIRLEKANHDYPYGNFKTSEQQSAEEEIAKKNEPFTRTGFQPSWEEQTGNAQKTQQITETMEIPEQTTTDIKEIQPLTDTRSLLERTDDVSECEPVMRHPDVCPLWERNIDQHPLQQKVSDVDVENDNIEVQLRPDRVEDTQSLGNVPSTWERHEDKAKRPQLPAEHSRDVGQRINDESVTKIQIETKAMPKVRRLEVVQEEASNRDSLSDMSDTTIRRRSARWDSEEAITGYDIEEGDEEELDQTSPLSRGTRARRRRFRHNHSSDDIKTEQKTCSDTERAVSVDEDWLDREKYFETLHSARSSISASSLSLVVTSTSQEERLSESLQSLTEEDAERLRSISDKPPRLHRTVKQLYAGRIEDRFDTLEEVAQAIEEAGLVHSRIIIGIDYTKSNMETGRKTFGGKCLHTIRHGIPNPYQEVIRILCKTLNSFDEDNMICAYGFGDSRTNDEHVFKLNPASLYCHGFEGVLEAYNLITPIIKLGGPTTFAPMIEEAIKIVESSRAYTILILIADGQLVNEDDTVQSIVKASNYPLSIVLVGVGDGPWDKMKEFDDALPERKFDNFQFVNYHQVLKLSSMLPGNQSADSLFALMALMEIPDQFMQIKQLGYLDQTTGRYLPPYKFSRD